MDQRGSGSDDVVLLAPLVKHPFQIAFNQLVIDVFLTRLLEHVGRQIEAIEHLGALAQQGPAQPGAATDIHDVEIPASAP